VARAIAAANPDRADDGVARDSIAGWTDRRTPGPAQSGL